MTEEKIKVIFRNWCDGEEVVALFPEWPGDFPGGRECIAYNSIFKYEGGVYRDWVDKTTPAKPVDYWELKEELEAMGLVLEVREKATQKMHEKRRLNAMKYTKNHFPMRLVP